MRHHPLAAAIVVVASSAAAESSPEVAKHFELGNQFYAEGRYDDALVEYDKAYTLSNNWKILYNRGQVLVMLRRDPEAIAAFEQYLTRGGSEVPDERRVAVEADLEKLRQRLANVTLKDAPPGVEVLVDGHHVATTPLSKAIVVGAGKHVLSLRGTNGIVFTKEFSVAAGDSKEVAVQLAPEPAKPAVVVAPVVEEGGLPTRAIAISLAAGIAAPLANVVRGRLDLLGGVELAGQWRPHPLFSFGFFVGGAAGRVELKSNVSTDWKIESKGNYSIGMGGVRALLHVLRDKYLDGYLGVDAGVWRETWRFSPAVAGFSEFEWAATSPAVGLIAGLDFPIARTWALGASARLFGTAVRSGDRFGCPAGDNRCDPDDLPGGGGLGPRGFFEVMARVTWSIPYTR